MTTDDRSNHLEEALRVAHAVLEGDLFLWDIGKITDLEFSFVVGEIVEDMRKALTKWGSLS